MDDLPIEVSGLDGGELVRQWMRTSTKVMFAVAAGLLGSIAFALRGGGASAVEAPHISNKSAKIKRNAMKAERVHDAETRSGS